MPTPQRWPDASEGESAAALARSSACLVLTAAELVGCGYHRVGAQIRGDYGASARQQYLGAALAYLAERASDEDGVAHFVRFRTTAAAASRSRSGTRNVNTGLKMSSRSRVNFELLMYQRPSIFS